MSSVASDLLVKYKETIAEEVNVKEVRLREDHSTVTITYIPLGQKIGALVGKETSSVIAAAKAGQVVVHDDGTIRVYEGDRTWLLQPDMYEIRYSGLEGDHQTVEGGVIVSLDMEITEDLKQEGIAREFSRFLNQMRKEANFKIDEKVVCSWYTDDVLMKEVFTRFDGLLREEALLQEMIFDHHLDKAGKSSTEYTSDEGSVLFFLSR